MTQIQNRSINQFLQGKSNHSHYNSSIKSTSIAEPYFNKNLFNKASTKISPHFETVREEYTYNDNKIKTILNQNLRSSNKNYYSINNRNHSEYIANNSSKNYVKNTTNKIDNLKSSEIRKNNSPENDHGYYNKTEDNNVMKRAMSNTYKRNNEETPINHNNQKNYYSNRKEDKKRIEIIQTSPSQPILLKNDKEIK